jgi:hypothetical protein
MRRQFQPKSLIWTSPCALAMTKGATIPIEAFEIQETLADVTMPRLMHAHHTVDPFHRTTGPHHAVEKLLDTRLGLLPLGP